MENQDSTDVHQATLEAILNNAVDAIITIDELGTIQSANPGTEQMFGYSVSELVEKNISVLMPNPYRDEHDGYLSKYRATGKREIIGIGREAVGLRKNGTTFPLHLAVSEIFVNNRRMFTGIVRDISDLKQVEQKLVDSERLAAIGQMVAGLAHESRNALQRSHACLANLALDVREMPDSLDKVHKVQRALDDLNFLMEEVRDYSAPIIVQRDRCDLTSIVSNTWQHILAARTRKSAPVCSVNAAGLFPKHVIADRMRIEQVIRNLLENALFACQQKIDVRLEMVADSNRPIRIGIQDDGEGISDEMMDKIFDPFFTTKTKGTGLGLAICQRIIVMHAGSLTVEKGDMGGARFIISLPNYPELLPS